MNKNNIIFQIILGLLISDFLVGFFHWIEDTYFCYNSTNPIIRYIAQDNELHHYYPRDIIVSSYLENTIITCLITILILITAFLVNNKLFFDYKYTAITFLFFASAGNIFHRFLHMRRCEKSSLLNFLQDYCILSNDKQHREHHRIANDNYCVIFYFTNVVLKQIHFWYIMEQIVYYTTGIQRREPKKFDNYSQIHTIFHEISKEDCPRILTKDELKILKTQLKRKFQNVEC